MVVSRKRILMVTSRLSFKTIAKYIVPEVFNSELLALVLELLHDQQRETNRIAALKLIGELHSGF